MYIPFLESLLDGGCLALHEPGVVDVAAGLVAGPLLVVDDQVGAGDGVEVLAVDGDDPTSGVEGL